MDLAGKKPIEKIAKLMGRSLLSIRAHACRHGISLRYTKPK